jgi:hypothetical protein
MTTQRYPYTRVPPYGTEPDHDDNTDKWRCTGCSKLSRIETLHNGLENGLELSGFAGYYGGFTDQYHQDSQSKFDEYNKAYFCHSCCVKLFKTFPALAINVGIDKHWGHHPCNDDTPCCDYSWKLGNNVNTNNYSTVLTAARDEDHQLYWKEDPDAG